MAENRRDKGNLQNRRKNDGKSIYDYELKDVNKDGKKNFGDTWLGDALGLDGKIGVQGPGMKESMKGARRNMGDSKKEVRPKARPKVQPKSGTTGVSGISSGPSQGGATAPRKEKKQMAGTGGPRRQSNRPDKKKPMFTAPKDKENKSTPAPKTTPKVTYEQWQSMSRSERKAKGLPETTLGWQWQKNPGQTKTTDKQVEENRARSNKRTGGMNRGGMVKSGKKDYKNSGMFYKSGSPRGYK